MHLTLKKEATRPPGMNILQQQAAFDHFIDEYNNERPHEALSMKCPADIYKPADRQYHGLPELDYALHDAQPQSQLVAGSACIVRRLISLRSSQDKPSVCVKLMIPSG